MPETTKAGLKERLNQLTAHLRQENPELLGIVHSFRRLDRVAYRLGLLEPTDSYATQVPWWPLISVLGTFSSGKSTFINTLLGQQLQMTGNQAVDDKFTVICYGREETPRVLPGLALDSDPRFPFYKVSRDIDEAMEGEGQRLDSYLQLKTSNREELRGKILIDSPGFDADAQRTSTLRITNHIVDLSDLVLVFFDARHPEPGAMHDTLEYLVEGTLQRPDFSKFLYILNQIDNAAREDNPEEVFAAWQRALAGKGLTTGRFYRIYDPSAAMPIDNERLRQRFEQKRNQDMSEIRARIDHLEVERSYRVAGKLEQTAKRIRDDVVPRLEAARRSWKRRTFWLEGLTFGVLIVGLLVLSAGLGYWDGLTFVPPPWLDLVLATPWLAWLSLAVVLAAALQLHRWLRKLAARAVTRRIRADTSLGEWADNVAAAFEKNVRSWYPFFLRRPLGWGVMMRRKVATVLREADKAIQELNDRYTNPSGPADAGDPAAQPEAAEPAQAAQAASLPAAAPSAARMRGTADAAEPPAPPEPAATGAERAAAAEPSATGAERAAAAEPSATGAERAAAVEPDEGRAAGTDAHDDGAAPAAAAPPDEGRAAGADAHDDGAAPAAAAREHDDGEGESEDEGEEPRTGTHGPNAPLP